ncbi:MAG: HAD-IIB family hydrolase [Rectinemataceae bacterium]|nr:HAD-IIB family hydrolase [Rectinemataceae bacterium]
MFLSSSGKSLISVLALDLDGTVVTHDYRMSDRTVAAVSRFKESGGDVLIASGRSARAAFPWAVRLGGVSGMICHNGAAVYATRHPTPEDHTHEAQDLYSLVASTLLPDSVARKLIDFSRTAGVHFHAFAGDDWLYERTLRGTGIYRGRAGFDGTPTDFDTLAGFGFFKAMFVDLPGPDMDDLALKIRSLLGNEAEVMFTAGGFLEVVAPGVSKAVGLAGWLCARGKTMAEVLALGDADNDEAMLLAAGIGVAMGSAPEYLKAKVGTITGTVDEDGAAAAIEAFLDGGS